MRAARRSARERRLAGGEDAVDAGDEFAERERLEVGIEARDVSVVLGGELEGEVRLADEAEVVLVGIVGVGIVLAAGEQKQAEVLRVGRVGAGDDGLVGGGDVGVGGLGEVGEEDVMPDRGARAGGDVLDVEDIVLEVLVEDAGLDFKGGLRGFELVFEAEQVGGAAGSEVEGVDEAEGKRSEREDGDDAHEAERSDAAGAHGGDFGVGGKAGEAEEDSGEDCGGDGDGESVGQHVGEDTHDVSEGGGVADEDVEDLLHVAHEEHEGEEDPAKQSVGGDFAEDVAGEDAHAC